jgi:CelD/BcsL family acetyltransferase involved in cellulose biosynthesis
MEYAFTEETFESITSHWLNARLPLKWTCVFILPHWLKVWWHEFGAGSDLYLYAVREGEDLIGIAPLLVTGEKASFIGDKDVCDYQDFIVTPERGQEFFAVLLDHLSDEGITHLDLNPLRPDSTVFTDLVGLAQDRGCEVSRRQEDVTLELDLPATWDEYLLMLKGKQRHEIKRKLRRLQEAADITYRVVEESKEVKDVMATFFTLFERSRADKAAFMTERMASFFNSLAETMAEVNILKLFILELDAIPAAAAMCFDYNSTIYLYNSGYDHRFSSLSAGVLCKVLSIKDSIQRGRKNYDFLKGDEAYKHRLGGKEVPLYRCQIRLKP